MARSGETILVMDRNDAVAEIRQCTLHNNTAPDKLEKYLDALEENGELARAKNSRTTIEEIRKKIRKKSSGPGWRDTLDRMRSDRY